VIRLQESILPTRAANRLRIYQAEIDAIPDYAGRVDAAKANWPQKNNSARVTFRTIRETLILQCHGNRRCGYCEDSCADEIEHIKPKDLYPESVFVWENYLYACGGCNVKKQNDFAIFTDPLHLTVTDVKRRPEDPVLPPPSGDMVLINPRTEDPLDYLLLDLTETFLFRPKPGIDFREKARATYTIKTLGLNIRDHLVKGRQNAFIAYRDVFAQYSLHKAELATQQEMQHRIDAIKGTPHRTVWEEMKRWYQLGWFAKIPKLKMIHELFEAERDALYW
jgi:ferredoxin